MLSLTLKDYVYIADIVQSGSQVILTCSYSVSPGEYIDSIKWYLNNSECYRIVPGLTQVPPAPYWSACLMLSSDWSQDRVLTFPPGGACISLPQSGILRPGTHRLVINNASQLCSGKYICQVTESRPPFKTEQAAAVLQVLGEAENNFALKILHLSRFKECITKNWIGK